MPLFSTDGIESVIYSWSMTIITITETHRYEKLVIVFATGVIGGQETIFTIFFL